MQIRVEKLRPRSGDLAGRCWSSGDTTIVDGRDDRHGGAQLGIGAVNDGSEWKGGGVGWMQASWIKAVWRERFGGG